jgi:hypothetical protein
MFDIAIIAWMAGHVAVPYRQPFQTGTGQAAAWKQWLRGYAKTYQNYYASQWGVWPGQVNVAVIRIRNDQNLIVATDRVMPPDAYTV